MVATNKVASFSKNSALLNNFRTVKSAISLLFFWLASSLVVYPQEESTLHGTQEVYLLKGNYYYDIGNYVAAIQNYDKSLQLDSTDITAWVQKAKSYEQLSFLEQAHEEYLSIISRNTKLSVEHLPPFLNFLLRQDRYDELKYWIAKGLKSTESNSLASILNYYKFLFRSGFPTESQKDFSSKRVQGFTVQTSRSKGIKLSKENEVYFSLDFTPGINYSFITEHDSYKLGKTVSTKQSTLNHKNIYTFHVQYSSGIYQLPDESIDDESTQVKFLHVNPGDLITFQLLPKSESVEYPGQTKIRVNEQETTLSLSDTILFSYIVEAGPSQPASGNINDLSQLAFKAKTENEEVLNEIPKTEIYEPDQIDKIVTATTIEMPDTLEEVKQTPEITIANSDQQILEEEPAEIVPEEEAILEESIALEQVGPKESIEPTPSLPIESDKKQESEIASISENPASAITTKQEDDDSKELSPTTEVVSENNETTEKEQVALNADDDNKTEVAINEENEISNPESLIEEVASSDTDRQESVIAESTIPEEVVELKPDPEPEPEEMEVPTDAFQFRVQVAASRRIMTETELKRIYTGSRKVKYFEEANYYKYYIAEVPSYEQAKKILQDPGIKDAFISVYKSGEKWSLSQAIKAQRANN